MIWRFGDFVLDCAAAELRGPDGPVHLERVPLLLLIHLVENSDRVISKEEANEVVWQGRFVADSSLSTAIRQIRRALDDTGTDQRFVKTVRGVGFRFVAGIARGVSEPKPAAVAAEQSDVGHGAGVPALAVLRFFQSGTDPFEQVIATALPAEIVTAISRTRWLQVIARGSSFRFDPVAFDPSEVAMTLGVGYLVTGTVEVTEGSIAVAVELLSTKSGSIIWAGRNVAPLGEVQFLRQSIVGELLTALETEIPRHEAFHARSLDAGRLDAWSHFHVGLTHVLRFANTDTVIAGERFRAALDLDPEFARAYAGLSLTHWQNSVMGFKSDRSEYVAPAVAAAERAVQLDPNDPLVAFTIGRTKWLEGDLDAAIHWIDHGIAINPNHVHCRYSWALIQALRNEPEASMNAMDTVVRLSPLDPLLGGFRAVQIANAVMLGDLDKAVESANLAVRVPGAYHHILITAAAAYELAGDHAAALLQRNRVLKENPDYGVARYAEVYPFQNKEFNAQIFSALKQLGLPD